MRKIKVLQMIDQPFLGGGQIHLLSLARGLDKSQFDISVCSKEGGAFVDAIKEAGITHFPVSFRKAPDREIIRTLRKIFKENQFDVLHTHGGVAGFYGRWMAHRCRVPVILHTLHGIHYLHYRIPLLKYLHIWLERWLSRFTDGLIFVSDEDKKRGKIFGLAPEKKMFVIKNGIAAPTTVSDKHFKKNITDELGIDLKAPLVGTIARLHRQKGIPILLKAARVMREAFPEVNIVIIGGGPLHRKLLKLNSKLKNEGFVRFLGERKDAHKFMSLFDVFVLSSLWEGLPYAVLEAGALGKAIVATDVVGSRELIQEGQTGVLVPPGDPDSLAYGIVRLLKDPEKAAILGANLKKKILEKYTLTRMIRQTQDLYLELLDKEAVTKSAGLYRG